jgi:hypothetical protein
MKLLSITAFTVLGSVLVALIPSSAYACRAMMTKVSCESNRCIAENTKRGRLEFIAKAPRQEKTEIFTQMTIINGTTTFEIPATFLDESGGFYLWSLHVTSTNCYDFGPAANITFSGTRGSIALILDKNGIRRTSEREVARVAPNQGAPLGRGAE